MLIIGLMSGTSMDGIDASLMETDGTPSLIKPLTSIEIAYTREFKILLKAAEFAIRTEGLNAINSQIYNEEYIINSASTNFLLHLENYLKDELNISDSKAQIADLAKYLGNSPLSLKTIIEHSTKLHAEAVVRLLEISKLSSNDVDLIGYHGQTFFHRPKYKISIILGDGQMLANLCQVKVVNDFRRNDIENGGQGAPLVPIYHQALALRDNLIPIVVINCGGIANITLINSDNPLELVGFDTGPGNGLVDRWVRMKTSGEQNMDLDGRYGLAGKINQEILQMLEDQSYKQGEVNYYDLPPPKSLDINDFKLPPEMRNLLLEDGCATLEAFTAISIVKAITAPCQNFILAGGGWYNPVIKRELERELKQKFGENIIIKTADEIGWSTKFLESQTFAYLAARSLYSLPLSFPKTTGVNNPSSGGKLYDPKV